MPDSCMSYSWLCAAPSLFSCSEHAGSAAGDLDNRLPAAGAGAGAAGMRHR